MPATFTDAAAAAEGAQLQEGGKASSTHRYAPTAAAMAQGQTRVSSAASAAANPKHAEAAEPTASQPSVARSVPSSRPECFNPNWVVFIQASSLFCKSDLQRLLLHTDADMACGMDMHVAEPSPDNNSAEQAAAAAAAEGVGVEDASAPATAEMLRRQLQQQHTSQTVDATGGSAQVEAAATGLALGSAVGSAAAAAAEADAWHERPPALDVWKHPVVYAGAGVGRMINGQPFSAAPFYANAHAPTLRRLVAGLPVQVSQEACGNLRCLLIVSKACVLVLGRISAGRGRQLMPGHVCSPSISD
jgi:hypothetical protein